MKALLLLVLVIAFTQAAQFSDIDICILCSVRDCPAGLQKYIKITFAAIVNYCATRFGFEVVESQSDKQQPICFTCMKRLATCPPNVRAVCLHRDSMESDVPNKFSTKLLQLLKKRALEAVAEQVLSEIFFK